MPSPEYMALVKTASGLTPERPYGKLGAPSPGAYAEWRALAENLAGRATERLALLGDVEAARVAARTQATFTKYNEFGLGARGLADEAQTLPTSFEEVGVDALADAIRGASQIAVDAAGLVEKIDYAMLYYGTHPPSLFGLGQASTQTAPSGLGVLGTIGAFAAIGVAIAAMVYLVRRSRAPATEAMPA